jgi:hypothetical protein
MRDFNHSVNVLVQAYLNNTLQHGNCYACAVGNIIADGLGTKCIVKKDSFKGIVWDNGEPYPGQGHFNTPNGWGALFNTDNYNGGPKRQVFDRRYINDKNVNRQISSTGYSWEELARIEYAFESVDKRKKDKMFNGLMAVVDVLADIHGIDLQIKEEAKALFVKA